MYPSIVYANAQYIRLTIILNGEFSPVEDVWYGINPNATLLLCRREDV